MISDDAAVYAHFNRAQECWAHLLRKAIKLTLQDPNNAAYRTLTDRLLEIYREACRVQRDGRLSDAGRASKVVVLDDEILDLCVANWLQDQSPSNGLEKDYRLLVNEVLRLMLRQELLTFETAKPTSSRTGRASRWMARRTKPSERYVARRSAADGSHQKSQRSSPANDPEQRAGIAAALPADLHAKEREGGDEAVVSDRAKMRQDYWKSWS